MAETEEAVRRFCGGDEEAFSQIIGRWERKIYNLAWRMLGNREDAQDVVQETFLSVFKSAKSLRDPASFATWVYRITLNHCRARWRDRQPASDEQQEGLPARGSGDRLEARDLIRKALSGLSEDHRSAIILKEYLGLSLEELARVMECPLSTAKSRLYHGLRDVTRNLKRMGVKIGGH